MKVVRLLDRSNLSDSAVTLVRQMIVDGVFPPGQRINEVHLAEKLGISRTPLREALTRLVAEGAIISRPRIGFVACPLTLEEFEQIYPIRAILDPHALRLAGLPTSKQLSRLEAMNKKIEKATEPATASSLDDSWHLELLSQCPNRVLIELIEQFMRRTRRYEIALMRENRNVNRTLQGHQTIIEALNRGDLDAACIALQENMESGKDPIVEWLKNRQTRK